MSAARHLRLVPKPVDPATAAIAKLSEREALRALIAGFRATRDAFEREVQRSHELTEGLLADLDQWVDGAPVPASAALLAERFDTGDDLGAWGGFEHDEWVLSLALEVGLGDRDARSRLERLRHTAELACPADNAASERVEQALERALAAALGVKA